MTFVAVKNIFEKSPDEIPPKTSIKLHHFNYTVIRQPFLLLHHYHNEANYCVEWSDFEWFAQQDYPNFVVILLITTFILYQLFVLRKVE